MRGRRAAPAEVRGSQRCLRSGVWLTAQPKLGRVDVQYRMRAKKEKLLALQTHAMLKRMRKISSLLFILKYSAI